MKCIDEICLHMVEVNKPNGYWNNYEICRKAALECKNRKEFSDKYNGAYISSHKNNWIEEFFPPLRKPREFYYKKENNREEALKYSTRSEF